MRTTASRSAFLCLVLAPFMAAGCGVQQDKYDQMLQSNRSLEEQNVRLSDQRDSASSNFQTVGQQLTDARTRVRELEEQMVSREMELERMSEEYDRLLSRVSTLEFGPLPPDVETALIDLTRAYPQVMTFDPERGMIRFSSDFTFGLGSADLQPEAAATIASLADILNSQSAANLEVRVIGHTDNVPIGKPDTRAKHPTNLHLSVHRAISVQNALDGAGIEPTRVQVAGYGEFRPVAANGRRGATANRRVEILLAPMPGGFGQWSRVTEMEAEPEREVMAPDDPMK